MLHKSYGTKNAYIYGYRRNQQYAYIYIYMALDNLSKVKRQLWPSHFTIGHEALTSGARIIENYADLSNTSI